MSSEKNPYKIHLKPRQALSNFKVKAVPLVKIKLFSSDFPTYPSQPPDQSDSNS